MKKAFSVGIIIIALTLSYIAYHIWIAVPQKLVNAYEECKVDATLNYSMKWIQQCDTQKPLSKECKAILTDGFPSDLHRAIRRDPWEVTEEEYNKYNAYLQKMDDCECETLPKHLADDLNGGFKDAEEKCLSELEAMTKLLK